MSSWNDEDLRKLFLENIPLIDVRAPIEFEQGQLPHSRNLPLLNDEERALIGTCYKEKGQDSAIKLGHELVSGETREKRLLTWENFLAQNPKTQVFCFRGGLRSHITCEWLNDRGHNLKPIPGGYKRMRSFFLSYLNEGPLPSFLRIGGLTGSGKTTFLNKLSQSVDLEGLANHRGSAFGGHGEQPSQITFENALAMEFLKHENQKILVEDESQMIGKRNLPKRHFAEMRNSPLIILKITPEERLRNLFTDYVMGSDKAFFLAGLERIRSRISHEVYSAILNGMESAFSRGFVLSDHEEWISLLLTYYYDPMYSKDIKRQQSQIVFEGNEEEVLTYLAKSL